MDAAGTQAPAELPAAVVQASIAQRPVLVARGEPRPVVILLDIEVRSLGG